MKKNLVCFLSLVLIVLSTAAQSKKAILKAVAVINSNETNGKIQVNNNDSISPKLYHKDTLTGYYTDAVLMKMVHKRLSPTDVTTFEYYFRNGKLIYIQENYLLENDLAFKGQYYFTDDKMIDMLTTGHNRFENDKLDPEKVLLKETNDHIKRLDKAKASLNKMKM